MSWNEFISWLGVSDGNLHWVVKVFIVVFISLVLNYILIKMLTRFGGQLTKTKNLWDDTLLEASKKPLGAMVWLIGLSWAAEIAQKETGAVIFEAVDLIRRVGVVALLTWFVLRFIRGAEEILVSPNRMKEPMDKTTVMALSKLLRASIVITATLVVMQTFGYSISGVLAFGGIGGIAVGFAAKDLLANFFGGLMVYLDRPFSVGDWIRSPDKQIEGTVEHIGWRQTCIRTFDKRPLYVPNATFTTIAVENPSRMSHRRIYETIGVRYDDFASVPAIVSKVEAMLRAHDDIDQTQTMIVNFNAFAASSLDFFVYTFTKTTNWIEYHKVKQDVLIKIMEIIKAEGGDVAFPTQTIHLPDQIKLAQQLEMESQSID
ncbi:mechanosensitive ion channel protein MscS [Hahella sp. CCB-MM4]|uniref:mechanosensitive ion channel family protein n=1 Tax=Hahella sp. (strain CCB-MM4) TaxID=1926491 RepID=UPI000B9AEF8B|nr:mechanosensitive ion channel family protein [Hahella sp. CCB-MM4]OZG73475.1 mechanosensitive ion channel protein MscS [Hahella sp. CCB-MM4]